VYWIAQQGNHSVLRTLRAVAVWYLHDQLARRRDLIRTMQQQADDGSSEWSMCCDMVELACGDGAHD